MRRLSVLLVALILAAPITPGGEAQQVNPCNPAARTC